MPITVDVPELGAEVEFPDGMSHDDIASAITKHITGFKDLSKDQPLTLRPPRAQGPSTTAGGPPLATPDIGQVMAQTGELAEQGYEIASKPTLPDLPLSPAGSFMGGLAKGGIKAAYGIPQFLSSPIGATAAAVAPAAPLASAIGFSGVGLEGVRESLKNISENWDKMTSGERGESISGLLASMAMFGLPAKAAVNMIRGKVSGVAASRILDEAIKDYKPRQTPEVPPAPLREQGVPTAPPQGMVGLKDLTPQSEAAAAAAPPEMVGEPTTKLSPQAEAAVKEVIQKTAPILPRAAKEAAVSVEEQARLQKELAEELGQEPTKKEGEAHSSDLAKAQEAQPPPPTPAPVKAEPSGPEVYQSVRGDMHRVWVKLPDKPAIEVGSIEEHPELSDKAKAVEQANKVWASREQKPIPPRSLPAYGISSKDVAKQYGMPEDFYGTADEQGMVSSKYRTKEYDAAVEAEKRASKIQGINGPTIRRHARERTESEFRKIVESARKAEPSGAKEPWQMGLGEFVESPFNKPKGKWVPPPGYHRALVEKALREGKPVPPEVLADYPDLKPRAEPSAPPPPAQLKGETAPVAKVTKEVQKVARTEGQRSAKEVKSELVDSLEQAIAKAPSEMGLSPSELEQVTKVKKWIHIPGDGDFNVVNSKEALGEVLARAKKISTSTERTGKVPLAKEGKVDTDELADKARKIYGTPENAITHLENQLSSGQEIDSGTRTAIERAIELLREDTAAFKHDKAIKELQTSIADAESKIKIGEEGKRVMLQTRGSRSRFNARDDAHWNQLEQGIKRAQESLTKDRAALSKFQESPPTPPPVEQKGVGPATGEGPGATVAGPTGIDPKAQIEQLADSFRNIEGQKLTIGEKLKQSFQVGERLSGAKDALSKALDGLKSTGNYLIGKWNQVQNIDDLLRAKGDLSAALETRGWRVRQWEKLAKKATPSIRDQAAIAKYVDAGGDMAELQRGFTEAPPKYKQAYQDAMNLKGDLKIAAENIRNYFDSRLQEAIDAGVLEHGVEDYIHRIYESKPAVAKKLWAYVQTGLLQKNPALTKKRIFQFDWEAEKLGYKPVQSYIPRIAQYESSLARAIAAREFIKKATTMRAADGRPVIDIKGVGIPIEDPAGVREATLIKPQFNPANKNQPGTPNYRGDYVNKEFPALSRWKWVAQDSNGKPIFVQGDVAIHPDYVNRVAALLEPSRVRYGRYGAVARPALNIGSAVKQTMLDLSGFHQVQTTVHGLEHRVNPLRLVQEIDFNNPDVDGLLKGGVTLGGDYRMQAEGLAGQALTRHIPFLGPALESYHQWLFQDYIPRLKMTMALHALERNKARYSGVKSPEEIYHQTASEANAAFGEQNYIMLERSKTAQDMARLILLAPDFLEARGRFAGQALTKGGKSFGNEQRTALLLGALTMYVTARILNKATTGQYHNEPENLFSVVHNGKAYGLRTVQGDILHLIEHPLQFWMHRLNPVFGRTTLEMATGRDEFGRKRSMPEQLWDFASTVMPISLRTSRERSIWESLANSFGINARRWQDTDDAFKLAKDWKAKHGIGERGEFIYDRDKDPLRPLKLALTSQDEGAAVKEIKKLIQSKTYTIPKLNDYFRRYASMPFTGSRANDVAWKRTLSEDQLKTVDAAKQHKESIRQLYMKALAKVYAE